MPRKGVFLPWLFKARRSTVQNCSGSKTQTSAGAPARRSPAATPSSFAGSQVILASAAGQRHLLFHRPFERERQQEFQAGRARLGFAERNLLAIVVDRSMVGTDEIDRAVGDARAQRRAVAHRAQRRHHVRVRVEPSDIDSRTGADDGPRHRSSPAGLPSSLREPSPRLRQWTACTDGPRTPGFAHQRHNGHDRDGLGHRRYARQAEARSDFAVMGDA
jgi:hypothetical protein